MIGSEGDKLKMDPILKMFVVTEGTYTTHGHFQKNKYKL